MKQDTRDPDVRFSLANERTFLAWGRTALALIAAALVVAKLFEEDVSRGLAITGGVVLAVWGCALALWSYVDYRRRDAAIRNDEPIPPSFLPIGLLSGIVLAGIVVFVVVISL